MNRVTINLEALGHNVQVIDGWMADHDATWTLVCKAICGQEETLKALYSLGIDSFADSRLANLETVQQIAPDTERWYLRPPQLSAVGEIVALAGVSLDSEIEVIRALNEEAKRQDTIHNIVVMIELGDLREGILPSALIQFYENVLRLSNVKVLGIGANLGCISGTVPNIDQFTQLVLYRELLELKFKTKLPLISAGTTAVLPLLRDGKLPKSINHFRIGEAVFLGTDLVFGGTLEGLRGDTVTVEGEIVEIREKSLVPLGETTDLSPFETPNVDTLLPGERGHRAVLSFGHLDTEVQGLVPLDDDVQIAGASSDLTVVNLADGPGGRKVGDTIAFRPSYGALVRMMQNQYMAKTVSPPLSEYQRSGPSVPLRAVHSSARIARSSQQPPTPEQMEAR